MEPSLGGWEEETAQHQQCVDLDTGHTTPLCWVTLVLELEHLLASCTTCPQGIPEVLHALGVFLRHILISALCE